ncbi:MAG: serine/threonine-protein phosphatase [Ruminococcus sp.]|nr:serine/threonine-protein phosphatase [Ruminococcus sp.]
MKFYCETNIGLRRDENQDSVKCEYIGSGSVLAAVCDGMGGEDYGREASKLAVEEFFHRFTEGYNDGLDDESIQRLLVSSVSAANTVVFTKARLEYASSSMGTTLVAAFVTEKASYIANVGDSRAYLITDTGLHRITNDHNVAYLLYEQGRITAEELKTHPQKHMLIRAVGVERTVSVDTFILDEFDDYTGSISLLLCSDGLCGYCSDDEIYDVIVRSGIDNAAKELIKLALDKGGRDNITVALVSEG